jgi:RNA polymerase sigma factor (TIGR02999 family)
MSDVDRLLDEARRGDAEASEQLAVLVYGELREMAQREMAGERPDHTLQPTALVHEAYMRLVSADGTTFENRAHFFGAAATAIRRVLVEHARKRAREKRGGGRARLDLDESILAEPGRDQLLVALDEALVELAEFAPNHARLVDLRFFAGMTLADIATLSQVSVSTVQRDWRIARAWLQGKLEEGDEA